jgi:hypothetical protein
MDKKLLIFDRTIKNIVSSCDSWNPSWTVNVDFPIYDSDTQAYIIIDLEIPLTDEDGLFIQPVSYNDPNAGYTYQNISKLFGYVKDSLGSAISGVLIEFIKNGQTVYSTTSGANGYFEILNVNNDLYGVKFSKSGYVTLIKRNFSTFTYLYFDFGDVTLTSS